MGLRLSDGRLGGGGFLGVFAIQAQAGRLGQSQAMLLRVLLHGRGLQLHTASGRSVGLGQYQSDVMTASVQSCQRVLRKNRRAGKDQAHDLALDFALCFNQFAANAGAFEQ